MLNILCFSSVRVLSCVQLFVIHGITMREATAMRSRGAAARECPCLPQQEKARAAQRLSAANKQRKDSESLLYT